MRKKAGILTLYHGNYNFGGLLQAYALPAVIQQKFHVDAEQIDYCWLREAADNPASKREKRASLLGCLYMMAYSAGILFFSRLTKRKLKKREHAFEKFMDEIPHSEKIYDYNTISACLERYEILICGGDQIWNDNLCGIKNTKIYTLQFASGNIRKIAYAPSMAISKTTEQFADVMREGMNQLDAISIREKRSLPLLQPLTNKRIEVVVDPVLLLKEDDWLKVIRCPQIGQKYILCYLLGDNLQQRKAVKRFSSHTKCKTVTFPHILCNVVRKCDLFFGDIQNYDGPREFLGLIQNAELVITDSFHACVFSMIFETPFEVFERNKIGEKGNMNSRIYDFLEEYHLERQLVTEEQLAEMNDIPKVDFTYAQDHWKKRRQESLTYLESALKDDNNGAKQ